MNLDPRKTALLIIDMQNDYAHPEGVFHRNGLIIENLDQIIAHQKEVIDFCKRLKIPVIYLRWVIRVDSEGKPVDSGLYTKVRPFLLKEGLRQGTWGAQCIEDLPAPDYDIEKVRLSGFYNTNLEVLLRGLHVDTILISGIYTNQCVETTARDAWARDFNFVLLEDCMTSSDISLHNASLRSVGFLGSVLSSQEIMEMFRTK